MDTYNDDWCQCPVCFEIYSSIHRPTTFTCGHSICIDHVVGENSLKECPVCRYQLESSEEYHISYSLEEAVHIFNALKASANWNMIIKKVKKVDIKPKEIVHYDSQYEEELKRNENLLDEIYSKSNSYSHQRSRTRFCGHTCQSTLLDTCCICANQYARSARNTASSINRNDQRLHSKRNKDFCSICKTRS